MQHRQGLRAACSGQPNRPGRFKAAAGGSGGKGGCSAGSYADACLRSPASHQIQQDEAAQPGGHRALQGDEHPPREGPPLLGSQQRPLALFHIVAAAAGLHLYDAHKGAGLWVRKPRARLRAGFGVPGGHGGGYSSGARGMSGVRQPRRRSQLRCTHATSVEHGTLAGSCGPEEVRRGRRSAGKGGETAVGRACPAQIRLMAILTKKETPPQTVLGAALQAQFRDLHWVQDWWRCLTPPTPRPATMSLPSLNVHHRQKQSARIGGLPVLHFALLHSVMQAGIWENRKEGAPSDFGCAAAGSNRRRRVGVPA